MRPYYEHGGITIYHGDATEGLPSLEIDAVVTDPPYGTGWYATDVDAMSPQMLAGLVAKWPVAVFGYATRLVRLCCSAGAYPSEWVTWWPTNGGVRGFNLAGLRREAEQIAIFGKHRFSVLRQPRTETSRAILEAGRLMGGDDAGRGLQTHGDDEARRLGNVWTDSAPGLGFNSHLRVHPNQKPLDLMRRLVDGMSKAGETVLDPFMGSGTTLRAAKDLGRKAIGIEIEERYCEIAAERLAQEVMFA